MATLKYNRENDVISAINFFQLNNKKVDINTLKSCYRALSKVHHPDLGGTHENMVLLNKYYELLVSKIKNGAGFFIDAGTDREQRDAATKINNENMKRFVFDYFEQEFNMASYLSHFRNVFDRDFEYKLSFGIFGGNRCYLNINMFDTSRDYYFKIATSFEVAEDNTIRLGESEFGYGGFKDIEQLHLSTEASVNGKSVKMTKDRYQHIDSKVVFTSPQEIFPSKKLLAGLSKSTVNNYKKADYLNSMANKFGMKISSSGDMMLPLGKLELYLNRITMTFRGGRAKTYLATLAREVAPDEKGRMRKVAENRLRGSFEESEKCSQFRMLMKGIESLRDNFNSGSVRLDYVQKHIDRITREQKIAGLVSDTFGATEPERYKNIDCLKYFDIKNLISSDSVGSKSKEKMIFLKIDDFMSLAQEVIDDESVTYYSAKEDVKVNNIINSFANGDKLEKIPALHVKNRGDGIYQAYDHEGRHRAMVLAAIGCDYIPVILKSDIRYSEQLDSSLLDYKNEWPEMLLSEDEDFLMEFPLQRSECESSMLNKFMVEISAMNGGKDFSIEDVQRLGANTGLKLIAEKGTSSTLEM